MQLIVVVSESHSIGVVVLQDTPNDLKTIKQP